MTEQPTVAPALLARLMASATQHAVFDVREAGEAEEGHIPGATVLPRRQLELRIGELVMRPDTPIVVYDECGWRAEAARATLSGLGYTEVRVLEGGLAAWQGAGHRLETGSNTHGKRYAEHLADDGSVPEINVAELARRQAQGEPLTVLDIRQPDEYARARIPGAWSAPSFEYLPHLTALRRSEGPVIVHCAGRTRSLVAAATLRRLGVEQAMALQDGTLGWMLSERELETGAGRGPLLLDGSASEARDAARRLAGTLKRVAVAEVAALLEARDAGRANLYLFDVRGLKEAREAHAAGALVVPGGQLVQRADDFIAVRRAPVVLVDNDDGRADVVGYWLRELGYDGVRILDGGLPAWRAANRPIARGRGRMAPSGLAQAEAAAPALPPAEAADLLQRHPETVVIDVDSSRSYAQAHLPRARWVPRGWLEARLDTVAPDKTAPVLVTCASGLQAAYAAATLRQLGYAEARPLAGGSKAWVAAGHPVERGPATDAETVKDVVPPPYARGREGMIAYLEWERRLAQTPG